MAGRGRGSKRKSEDFIYEVDVKDLSSDEEDSVKLSTSKISRIDGESTDTSNTKITISTVKEKRESIGSDASVEIVSIKTNEMEKSPSDGGEISFTNTSLSRKSKRINDNIDVIEIDDSNVDPNSSVVIIEDPVPVMVVSDDEVEEEGEIVEDLKVVDEVCATPKQKSPKKKSPQKENPQLLTDDEEFQVVEEIGPSPIVKQKQNLMSISFSSQKTMEDYGHLLIKFLKSFPEIETAIDKLCIRVNEKETFSEIKTPKKRNKKKKAKKDLFVVDTNPSSNDDAYFNLCRYTSKFSIEEEAEPESVATNSRSAQSCFNCGGVHALRDCSAPRNQQRINQARQQFLDRNKTVRYHVEQNQRLANFKPGVISENLRNALGLHKNELPNHIYRMRQLGYPPGWLEEAKILPSDLNMFNIDGEKLENSRSTRNTIDPDKIVDYPGFNVPLKKGCYDEFKRHNVKPYNKSMHKSFMIKYYQDLYQHEGLDNSCSDMDISNMKKIENKVKEEGPVNSPTVVDLEEKKKELINQLNRSPEQEKPSTANDSEVSQEDIEEATDKEERVTAVKNTALGTPILKSSSPYSRLPNPDNFSVGVSPVIDFENLPNSTGKYEELSKVLGKVRMTMKNML